MMQFLSRLVILSAIVLLSQPLTASADNIYLALGDSSAYGETNRTRNPSNGDRGYVAPFADFLATRNGGIRPTVLNLAINGETTSSFFTGTGRVSSDGQGFNTNYIGRPDPFPQFQEYVNRTTALTLAGNQITNITVQLGANNLDGAASNPAFLTLTPAQQQAAIANILAGVQADYINVLGDIRARFPQANVYAIGYHNPYNGEPTHPLFPIADPAVRGLNQVISGVAPVFGVTYVDFYSAINPNEATLTLMSTFQTDPVNFVHLNDQGYAVASQQLIRTASVPTPPAFVLSALAFGLLGVRRRRRQTSNSATAA